MKLWHGTTSRWLDKILEDGLLTKDSIEARGDESRAQWAMFPSRPDRVYLTDTYPLYFATAACAPGESLLVVEVEVDEDELEPDEDFIVQGLHYEGALEEKTRELLAYWHGFDDQDLEEQDYSLAFCHGIIRDAISMFWSNLGLDSIQSLGTAAHVGDIDPEQITRYALVDMKAQPGLTVMSLDPSISLINKAIIGPRYTEITRWVFGDRETIPGAFEGMTFLNGANEYPEFLEAQDKARMEASKDRRGITVVDLENVKSDV